MPLLEVNVSYLEVVPALACFVAVLSNNVVISVSFEGVLLLVVVLRSPMKGKTRPLYLDNLVQ